MKNFVSVKLTGFEEGIKLLGAYQLRKRYEIIRVLDLTTLLVESDAKKLSPVDTGRNRAGIVRASIGTFKRTVTANTEYAVYLEFGTKYQPARPFMFPAAENNRQQFIRNLTAVLRAK